jgi:GST-like protein
MSEFILHGRPGWGSAIVEAQLAYYELPYRLVEVGDLFDSPTAREALQPLNPIAQVPTLVLPDGTVMTESAAITLHLADITRSVELVPAAQARDRGAFLRWLVFLVANVYPTFTYTDLPGRFVKTPGAEQPFRAEVDAYAQRLWRIIEAAAGAPWFLGEHFSALDLFLAVMTRWRPGQAWFTEHAPRLAAAATRAAALSAVAPVIQRNFPEPA